MKKTSLNTFFLACAFSLSATSIFAQGPFASFNLGYSTGMGSQTINDYTYVQNTSGSTSTYEAKNLSFGKGLNITGAFGYMFNKNIGAELGLSYLMGGTTTRTSDQTGMTSRDIDKYEFSSNMFRINPTFILTAGFEKLNPYAKFGMIFGIGSVNYKNEYTETNTITSTTDVTVMNTKLSGGLAFGFNSSIGVLYSLNDNLSLFGELNMVNLTYTPAKGEVTELTYNGSDKLSELTTHEREIEFVDSYTTTSGSPSSDSSPDIDLKNKLPFGSFGINFGVKFNF